MPLKGLMSYFSSQDSSPATMGDQPPAWMKEFLQHQTATLTAVLDRHLSSRGSEQPESPPRKKSRKSRKSNDKKPPSSPASHPRDADSDAEFDRRFGHLIGTGDDNDVALDGRHRQEDSADEDNQEDSEDVRDDQEDSRQEDNRREDRRPGSDSEDDVSVDGDIVRILKKVPNWDTSSSVTRFIEESADDPLPDEFLKELNDEYVPNEKLQSYFLPPKLPSRLWKAICRMKSKGALKTEKGMFAAQAELFIIAKPLLAAFIKLRHLGKQVSEARELMCISLHGIFSVSLKISRARRENVRFLFKDALAEVLYTYSPRYCSMFGGESFNSQVEKATKESKVDLSWSKSRPSVPYQTFRNQGFRTGGSSAYYHRQTQRGRRGSSRSRGGYNNNNNRNYGYKKSSSNKSRGGSGGGKSQ